MIVPANVVALKSEMSHTANSRNQNDVSSRVRIEPMEPQRTGPLHLQSWRRVSNRFPHWRLQGRRLPATCRLVRFPRQRQPPARRLRGFRHPPAVLEHVSRADNRVSVRPGRSHSGVQAQTVRFAKPDVGFDFDRVRLETGDEPRAKDTFRVHEFSKAGNRRR